MKTIEQMKLVMLADKRNHKQQEFEEALEEALEELMTHYRILLLMLDKDKGERLSNG